MVNRNDNITEQQFEEFFKEECRLSVVPEWLQEEIIKENGTWQHRYRVLMEYIL